MWILPKFVSQIHSLNKESVLCWISDTIIGSCAQMLQDFLLFMTLLPNQYKITKISFWVCVCVCVCLFVFLFVCFFVFVFVLFFVCLLFVVLFCFVVVFVVFLAKCNFSLKKIILHRKSLSTLFILQVFRVAHCSDFQSFSHLQTISLYICRLVDSIHTDI